MTKAREYEMIMVLSPAIDDERASSAVERIHGVITGGGGSLMKHEPWGMRRLAYPVQDYNEGNYFLTQFSGEPGLTGQLEGALRLSEEVLRHLVVKLGS